MKERIQARKSRRLQAIAVAVFIAMAIGYVGHMDFQDAVAKTQGPSIYFSK